jgi:hypothetical protein
MAQLADRIFRFMLTIRVCGTSLKAARTRLGWSLQELAAR